MKLLHPLITQGKNSHYDKQKTTAIEDIEEYYTVNDCVAWCRLNREKYLYRRKHKGQTASDDDKVTAYESYLTYLYKLKNLGCGEMLVKNAWVVGNYKWRFR